MNKADMSTATVLIEEAFEFLSAVDPFDADVSALRVASCEDLIDEDVSRATNAAARAAMAMADLLASIDDTLRDARSFPHVFIGPVPAGRHEPSRDQLEFARQSAVSQLAVELGVSETTVATYAKAAEVLRTRLPRTWDRLLLGQISYQKARLIAETAESLPDDEAVVAEFDRAMADSAVKLTPPKLRVKARAMRERLHPQDPITRHTTAVCQRRVWFQPDDDGMTWQGSYLSADAAARAKARIEANARDLADRDGETRSLAQLQADVLTELLTGDGTEHAVKATVNVTVPVMTLLGKETPEGYRANPAVLNGLGPIDPDMARRLCADAPSLFRLLTDPIDGAILTADRKSYRPHADLKRLLHALMPVCAFPGCNRQAEGCDIDHSLDWILDGRTKLHNLAPLCRHHHRLKHNSLWRIRRAETTGTITWTTPRGATRGVDPPPF